MAVFFTSDTHFGHASVIRSCERPFASTQEMDEALIARWNARVRTRDTIYHLGDFGYDHMCKAPDYLGRLNGQIHLIAGNHDAQLLKDHAACLASVSLIEEIAIDGQELVLCHYPMREWNGCFRGAWHLHGHVHGRLNHEPLGHSLDVGVDSNGFQPWSFEEIAEILRGRISPFGGERTVPVRKTIREPWPQESP